MEQRYPWLRLLVTIIVLASIVTGCVSGTTDKPKEGEDEKIQQLEINLATAYESKHGPAVMANKFKELVEQRSENIIKVNVLSGGATGGEEDCAEQVGSGAMQMHCNSATCIYMYNPEYGFIDQPFAITDWEQLKKIYNSEIFEEVQDFMVDRGNQRIISIAYKGLRHMTANKEIKKPEDLKGLKLRLPAIDTWVIVWEALGATAVPIPINELYMALTTGVADASEGELGQIYAYKLHEVQNCISLLGHKVEGSYLYINEDFYNNLNADTKELIEQAATEAGEYTTSWMMEKEQEYLDEIKKSGVNIVEADKDLFNDKARKAVEEIFEKYFAYTYDEIVNIH